MSKRKARVLRHAFRFKMAHTGKVHTHWAKVIEAKQDVFIPLRAEHVRRSIELNGAGNSQTCSMAICAKANEDCFPHVVEGTIDWFYSRAFVVAQTDRNGLPRTCYVYAHGDGIAKMNDSPGGQRKLLKELEAVGGERIVHLRVVKNKTKARSPGKGRRDGSRTKVISVPRGARLRWAVAQAGAVV